MKNRSKRNKIINAILIVIYILTISVMLFLTKSNLFNKNTVVEEVEVIPNDSFKKVSIKDLDAKIKKLSFVNKKQDYVKDNSFITLNSNINNGKVTISLKIKDVKREYIIDNIENAKSIGSYLILDGTGTHVSYILTDNGLVYRVEDDLKTVSSDEKYKGKAVDLGLIEIDSIAINHTLKLSLLDDKTKVKPFVYAKMKDGRIFSDESFVENEKIVELIQPKEENTSEN